MKYVKCLYSTEELFKQLNIYSAPVHRVTHDVIYEVFSLANCEENEFWIVCDDSSKGRFRLNKTEEDVYFVDATQELREEKLESLGI